MALDRRTPLRRVTRIRPINPARRARARVEDFGEQAARCRASVCCACAAQGRIQQTPTQPHHEPPIGRSRRGKDADTVPLCATCHDLRHAIGVFSFWAQVGVSWVYVRDRMREGATWSELEALPF
jgi:hypothetical protein